MLKRKQINVFKELMRKLKKSKKSKEHVTISIKTSKNLKKLSLKKKMKIKNQQSHKRMLKQI